MTTQWLPVTQLKRKFWLRISIALPILWFVSLMKKLRSKLSLSKSSFYRFEIDTTITLKSIAFEGLTRLWRRVSLSMLQWTWKRSYVWSAFFSGLSCLLSHGSYWHGLVNLAWTLNQARELQMSFSATFFCELFVCYNKTVSYSMF